MTPRSGVTSAAVYGAAGSTIDAYRATWRPGIGKDSARYLRIVEWSGEDAYFDGQCPGFVGPCCHGDDEAQVYVEPCRMIGEWIAILRQDGRPLPLPTLGRHLAAKLLDAA